MPVRQRNNGASVFRALRLSFQIYLPMATTANCQAGCQSELCQYSKSTEVESLSDSVLSPLTDCCGWEDESIIVLFTFKGVSVEAVIAIEIPHKRAYVCPLEFVRLWLGIHGRWAGGRGTDGPVDVYKFGLDCFFSGEIDPTDSFKEHGETPRA